MSKKYLNKILKSLRLTTPPPQKMALAISGGMDSMCMAFLLHNTRSDFVCLVVDHGLRKESKKEAEKTVNFLISKNIEAKLLTLKCFKDLNSSGNIQCKARDARYDILLDYCRKNKIPCLLTAHNKNDQAETVLIRIERGSGIDGISGIPRKKIINGITILRPLLEYNRKEIEEIMQEAKWEWVEDPTNRDIKFTRNRIRKTLQEQDNYDALVDRLELLASNANRCRNFLEQEVIKSLKSVCRVDLLGYAEFDKPKFLQLHEEIQLRILSLLLKAIGGNEYTCKLSKLEMLLKNIVLSFNSCSLMKCEIIQHAKGNKVLFIKEKKHIKRSYISGNDKTVQWDGRFQVNVNGKIDEEVNRCISTLDEDSWSSIKKEKDQLPSYKIMMTTPALFVDGSFACSLVLEDYAEKNVKISAKSILEENFKKYFL